MFQCVHPKDAEESFNNIIRRQAYNWAHCVALLAMNTCTAFFDRLDLRYTLATMHWFAKPGSYILLCNRHSWMVTICKGNLTGRSILSSNGYDQKAQHFCHVYLTWIVVPSSHSLLSVKLPCAFKAPPTTLVRVLERSSASLTCVANHQPASTICKWWSFAEYCRYACLLVLPSHNRWLLRAASCQCKRELKCFADAWR